MEKIFRFSWSILFLWTATLALDRPHIIVIVVDDLGWNDVSFHGSAQIPTPNLDALAADGLHMSNYYVNQVCTPSRSAFLTGYYPIHTGLQHDTIHGRQPYGLPLNFTLLPQHLKRLGYTTRFVGKWHLGFFRKEYTPLYRGFDSHYGYWLGRTGYFEHTYYEETAFGLALRDNMEPDWSQEGRYTTELFTEKAVNVIRNHDSKEPLFLYFCHLGVHSGNNYANLEAPAQYTSRFPHIVDINRKLFAGMMSAVDDSVGEVVRALRESRLLNNSIILVTTDNGGPAGGYNNNHASNWPLRGTKGTLWEGGVRGTSVLWSPKLSASPGSTNHKLMHIVDWMPTLYAAAGGNPSELGAIDGVSMWPAINGKGSWPRNDVLLNIDPILQMAAYRKENYKVLMGFYPKKKYNFWIGPSGRDNASESIFPTLPARANQSMVAQALRSIGRNFKPPSLEWYWKNNVTCPTPPLNTSQNACVDSTKGPCLFNVQEDPCETTDISKYYPEILSEMMEALENYNRSSVPPRNKPNDPRADPKFHNFLWTNWMDDDEK